jgi:hypothetical protein
VLTHQPTEATAERQAGDSGVGHLTPCRRQAVTFRGTIQFSPQHAGFSDGLAAFRVNRDPFHLGEIDHQPVLANSVASHVVAASSNTHMQTLSHGQPHRCCDLLGRAAARDDCRATIDHSVPNAPGLRELGMLGQ